ncbi:putative transcription factor TGA like domain-containing protein [Rosa chinensis]|uniref:Putative transcription factor TGA like domain-containing protein n=1 Tax=Rosa chinensis TaxID=74649 RepID=A0A2P6RT06_ROSCH|nr:protein DELAY OF GERMINATION 1 [Rosa chinensis]PRQ49570.1 putative transcription factor TGA like domain-containing protein [Rosa chinensis]
MAGDSIVPKPEPEHEKEGFQAFFECWISEQNQNLEDLVVASKRHQNKAADDNGDDDQVLLSSLVEGVMKHYESYYNAKSQWVEQDALEMLSPPWTSSLEHAFLWLGGWRPSMAFHLLYSKSGMQLEACFAELMRGSSLSTGDLGDLSQCQLTMVDKLQRRTIEEEKHVSEKMAKLQETMADTAMVELSHVVSEMMRNNNGHEEGIDDQEKRIESTLASKEEGLEKILHKADDLRLRTLNNITQILSSIQAVHFLIAAAELHLRLHDWGKMKDASRY